MLVIFTFLIYKTKKINLVEIEPNNCQVLGLYGDFLLHSGDFSSASTILKRCIELEPDAGNVLFFFVVFVFVLVIFFFFHFIKVRKSL